MRAIKKWGNSFRKLKSKKGFTLIELIVAMAIVAVLVLLATPNFSGKTKEAKIAKYINNMKVLEDASERYYIDHGKWPRGDEEPYTPEEVNSFSDTIYELSGKEIKLAQGNYWNIDYEALEPYAQLPEEDERDHYVLRNPVGKVYALDGLTDSGKNRTVFPSPDEGTNSDGDASSDKEDSSELIVLHGFTSEAFDGDDSTFHSGAGYLNWDGDMSYRELVIKVKQTSISGTVVAQFYNEANEVITPLSTTEDYIELTDSDTGIFTKSIIVPEGAVKLRIYNTGYSNTNRLNIYEISGPRVSTRPESLSLNSSSTGDSINLSWGKKHRVRIYKNGLHLADVTGDGFVDKPLYSNSTHDYDLLFLDEYGNGRMKSYSERTLSKEINFIGLHPSVFDDDDESFYNRSGYLSWDGDISNRELVIKVKQTSISGNVLAVFYDESNAMLNPVNSDKESVQLTTKSGTIFTKAVVVPKGAVKVRVYGGGYGNTNRLNIYDIRLK